MVMAQVTTGSSVRIEHEPWDTAAEEGALRRDAAGAGAIVSCTGLVRETDSGTLVRALYLEHYPGMTERSIAEITERAKCRWPLLGTRIVHRVGEVPMGDVVVQLVVAAHHRAAAFDAAAFIMDYLKTQAPLWKKELRADGEHWVGTRDSDTQLAARWRVAGAGKVASDV